MVKGDQNARVLLLKQMALLNGSRETEKATYEKKWCVQFRKWLVNPRDKGFHYNYYKAP